MKQMKICDTIKSWQCCFYACTSVLYLVYAQFYQLSGTVHPYTCDKHANFHLLKDLITRPLPHNQWLSYVVPV